MLKRFVWAIILLLTVALDASADTLNPGDPAPPLQVRAFLKGSPVTRFVPGLGSLGWAHP